MVQKTVTFLPYYPPEILGVTPKPAKLFVPEWYKNAKKFNTEEQKLDITSGVSNLTFKHCVPFLESLTSGYILPLWCDVLVKQTSIGPIFEWSSQVLPIETRRAVPELPPMEGYSSFSQAWRLAWGVKTPKGYSSLFVSPLNRSDLPFITSSGVVDTDKFSTGGNLPFGIKKDFEGVIPQGTPIVQVIPFRRDEWASYTEDHVVQAQTSGNRFIGWYKQTFWSKKTYQ
jgi:hypothetical protein